MEAAIGARDWDAVECHAAALERYTRSEPLPWADFFVARGRALVAHGRGSRGTVLAAELARLRDDAERIDLKSALPLLQAALAAA
jgi:hypothetical protein